MRLLCTPLPGKAIELFYFMENSVSEIWLGPVHRGLFSTSSTWVSLCLLVHPNWPLPSSWAASSFDLCDVSLHYFLLKLQHSHCLCPILPLNFKFRTFFYLRSVILFLFLCISLDWCIYFHAFKKYFYLAIQKFASAVPTCPLKSILPAPTAPLIPLYVSVAQYILHVKLNLQI